MEDDLATLFAALAVHVEDRVVEHSSCTFSLTNLKSDIKQIVVESPFYHKRGSQFTTVPQSFVYLPSGVDSHPFTQILPYTLLHDLPTFLLTNRENMIYAEHEWAARDTVIGFGSDLAHALLAELLLNASAPSSAVSEIFLEGESGFRGVGPLRGR